MTTSILLAQILGLLYLVMGLSFLLNHKLWSKCLKDFSKNPGTVLLWGFVAIMMGLLMVSVHNLWVNDWRAVITVFGWAALLKGIFLLLFPLSAAELAGGFKSSKGYLIFAGIVCLGLAGFFLYYAFWI